MNFLNNMKIGVRLNLILSLVMVLIISSLGIYIIFNERNKVFADTDLRMFEQVEDLGKMVETEINLNQQRVNTGMEYAELYFNKLGSLIINENEPFLITAQNQITKSRQDINVASWYMNNEKLQNSNFIVDAITEKIGGTATIFQKIPQGYLRISTNVINKEGKRGTGTYIPNESPVAQAISRGESFTGRAFVVDDWYLTSYKPMFNNGEVVGILYYGVKEKNLEGLKNIFYSKKYFDSGYPYLVASNGDVIIHPTKEGGSFADEAFFHDMKNSGKELDKSDYEWEGKMKSQFFKYIESIDSYVSANHL
jgi:methyl-accepting chemotaxis protein